jgi:MFS transporter, DHA1 family, multidrug resistance protein
MVDYIRDAPLGLLIRYMSRNTTLQYPDEMPGFVFLEKTMPSPATETPSQVQSPVERDLESQQKNPFTPRPGTADSPDDDLARHLREALTETETKVNSSSSPGPPDSPGEKVILVDWYSSDDAENPQNWTSRKKGWVTFLIW